MDPSKLVERIKSILTTPGIEWPRLAAEPASASGLYTSYIAILAALPSLAGIIKLSWHGGVAFGIAGRSSITLSIVGMLMQYVLVLVMVYVMALAINALAGTFGGQQSKLQALKTVAYAATPSWLAGVAIIIPWSWLGGLIVIAGAFHTSYLLYLGLPHTMKCPPEKATGYTAVSIIIALALRGIISLLVAGVFFISIMK